MDYNLSTNKTLKTYRTLKMIVDIFIQLYLLK